MSDEVSPVDTDEHSLLLAARLIALERAQRNIQHRLLTEPGDEAAQAKLEGIGTEIAHLKAIRDGEPAALAFEAREAGTTDRTALQAIKDTNTGIAMTALPDGLSEAAARHIVQGNLAALEQITDAADRFAALQAMGSSAAEQTAYRAELARQSPAVAKEAEAAFNAALLAWEAEQRTPAAEQAAREAAMKDAAEAIRAYAGEEETAEYSYIDTFNPEGLPPSHFHERAELARSEMIAALARLSDADAAQVLAENPRGDHDGSTFPAADIEEIRAHRAGLQAVVLTDNWLFAELRHAGLQVVRLTGNWQEELADGRASKLAEEFRAARDEQEFHRLFTDIRSDPAVADDLIARVAHLLTDEHHETREAALGAIEIEFHTRGQGREHTPTQGGGR